MDRVGDLVLGADLGRTGLISTYEATRPDGSRARLRLVEELDVSPSVKERFEQDAEVAGQLKAPGLEPVVAWSSSEPLHVATAPIDRTPLATILEERDGPLGSAVAVGLCLDVARALEAAHGVNLIHAGLAGTAVLVDGAGKVVLTDFAIARLVATTSGQNSTLMRSSIDALTPEQMSNPEDVGPGTDVFGLGVLLYRCLSGRPPFDAPSALGISIRLSMGHADPIEKHGVDMPPEASKLVMSMLKAKPADRPSMGDVVRQLDTLVDRGEAWRRPLGEMALPHLPPTPSPSPVLAPAAPEAMPSPAAAAPAAPAPFIPGPAPAAAAPPPAASPGPPPPAPPLAPPVVAAAGFGGAPAPAPRDRSGPGFATEPGTSGYGLVDAPPPWAGASPAPSAAPAPLAAPAPAVDLPTMEDADWDEATDGSSPWDDAPPTMVAQAPVDEVDDIRPTVVQDAVPEDQLPDYLREYDDDDEPPTSVLMAEARVQQYLEATPHPDEGGWPVTDDEPQSSVPRTVIMQDPSLASSQSLKLDAPVLAPPAVAPPPASALPAPPPGPARSTLATNLPPEPKKPINREWILWAVVGMGAMALLAGTVVAVIMIAG